MQSTRPRLAVKHRAHLKLMPTASTASATTPGAGSSTPDTGTATRLWRLPRGSGDSRAGSRSVWLHGG